MKVRGKPLAEVARGGLVMVDNVPLPAKTLPEVVAYVKAHPGKVDVASYSAGTLSHVMGLQLNQAAGIDMTHVGYAAIARGLAEGGLRARRRGLEDHWVQA